MYIDRYAYEREESVSNSSLVRTFCRQLFAQFSASFVLYVSDEHAVITLYVVVEHTQLPKVCLSLSLWFSSRVPISSLCFFQFLAGFCSRITLHNRTLDAYLNYYKLVFIFAENLNDFGLLHHCNKLAHTHCERERDRDRGRYTHIFTDTNFKLK